MTAPALVVLRLATLGSLLLPWLAFWTLPSSSALPLLCQAAMVAGALAVRAGLSIAKPQRAGLVLPFLCVPLGLAGPGIGLHDRLDRNHSAALAAIQKVHECAKGDASRCGLGGASTLATSGHIIHYEPGPRDASGRIAGYSVSARPRGWGCTSWTSYLSDESGAIHATDENRPATLADR